MTGLDVEIRVPVSPTPEFALMLSVLSSSLRCHSGIPDPQITVFIGAPETQVAASKALAEWMAPDMSPVIIDTAEFEKRSFHATAARRVTWKSNADVVILVDADVVICGDLTEICQQTVISPAISGVIAHLPPFSSSEWYRVFSEIGVTPRFPFRYSGWPYMKREEFPTSRSAVEAPAYFNLGFVVTTSSLLADVSGHYESCAASVERLFPDFMFRSQVAFTMALEKARVPVQAIPMRYNFANDYRLEALYPDELRDARLIHLLRRNQGLDKHQLYKGLDTLAEFVAEPWRWAGATARARDVVDDVLFEVEKKGIPDGLAEPVWAW